MANPKQTGLLGWVRSSLWLTGGLVIVAVIAMALGHNVQHMGLHLGAGG